MKLQERQADFLSTHAMRSWHARSRILGNYCLWSTRVCSAMWRSYEPLRCVHIQTEAEVDFSNWWVLGKFVRVGVVITHESCKTFSLKFEFGVNASSSEFSLVLFIEPSQWFVGCEHKDDASVKSSLKEVQKVVPWFSIVRHWSPTVCVWRDGK